MNRQGDAGSCAALASVLRGGSASLRAAAERERAQAATDVADAVDDLAAALGAFAVALRDPVPPRPGRPHPHTALRSALRTVTDRLGGP